MATNKKNKIMIVEDDSTQSMMYSIEFSNFGYDLLLAESGKQALEMAKKERPDLILLDMVLGDMTGVEILKKLKADPITAGSKVVVLSNLNKKELTDEAKEAGAHDVLLKMQFVPKEIVQKVEKYLEE